MPKPEVGAQVEPTKEHRTSGIKFILFSLIGIFAFFVPVTINGESSILIGHLVAWITATFPSFSSIYALLMILIGAAFPFYTKSWNDSGFEITFSILKVLGLIAAIYIFFNMGPAWMMREDMGPFLFFELIVQISFICVLSGVFLTFLMGYGLLDFIGVFFQKIMQPIWKVPGRSALIALTSRFASIIVVYLMTDQDYRDGKYTVKEAVTIATGFLAVEIPMMLIIARTVDIMHIFPLFFLISIFSTFLVTAIMVRVWPINRMKNDYYQGTGYPEETVTGNYLTNAWNKALEISSQAPPFGSNLWMQFKEAIIMVINVLPIIMSVGLIALTLAEYTPIFDYIAYIFYPFTWLLQVPDAFLAAKAIPLGITEILLPSILVMDAGLITRVIVAAVSVSGVLFFSTSIPCILATEIPVSVPKLIVIWFIRTILSLIVIAPIAYLVL